MYATRLTRAIIKVKVWQRFTIKKKKKKKRKDDCIANVYVLFFRYLYMYIVERAAAFFFLKIIMSVLVITEDNYTGRLAFCVFIWPAEIWKLHSRKYKTDKRGERERYFRLNEEKKKYILPLIIPFRSIT